MLDTLADGLLAIAIFAILFALSIRHGARPGHGSAHDLEAHRA